MTKINKGETEHFKVSKKTADKVTCQITSDIGNILKDADVDLQASQQLDVGSLNFLESTLKSKKHVNYNMAEMNIKLKQRLKDSQLDQLCRCISDSHLDLVKEFWVNPTLLSSEGWEYFKEITESFSEKIHYFGDDGGEINFSKIDMDKMEILGDEEW